MTESSAKTVHEAIHAVMSKVGYVQKERKQGLNYTFASERALIEALRPAMLENGLYCHVAQVQDVASETYETKGGGTMRNTRILATVRFTHAPSQTFIDVMATGEGADVGDKSCNKAMTSAYKYAMRQTFCIETGDDPDEHPSDGQEAASRPPVRPIQRQAGRPITQKAADKPDPWATAEGWMLAARDKAKEQGVRFDDIPPMRALRGDGEHAVNVLTRWQTTLMQDIDPYKAFVELIQEAINARD